MTTYHDYPTTKCTRRCHVSNRPLSAGEQYISMLVPSGDELTRVDVASEQWQGPSQQAVGWWKCRMPTTQAGHLRPAPAEVLLDVLSDLLTRPAQSQLAYLLALLLVRRRILIEQELLELSGPSTDDGSIWQLTHPVDGRQYQVPVALPPSGDQSHDLQEQLMKLLYTEE
ncbi:MAG: hypothetical protein KF752_14075 [Pirellulaceae bacterium]|nr:hypothetical protein [Pirellulaceae bacterium]